jgi:3-oxoacyl-[acyl-carrier protein] reductase
VITGTGSGIGQAVVVSLAKRGVKALGLVDRKESVRTVAEMINQENGDGKKIAEPFLGDNHHEVFQKQTFDRTGDEYGTPTICVPAAGITRDEFAAKIDKVTGRALLYPRDTFRLVVGVNLIAPIYWTLEMVGRIAEARHAGSPKKGYRGRSSSSAQSPRKTYLARLLMPLPKRASRAPRRR